MSMLQGSSSRATSAVCLFGISASFKPSKVLKSHVTNNSWLTPLVLESHQPRCADQGPK